jgi:hypothetical protein
MLRSIRKFRGHSIAATDGDIGKVDDVLFDVQHWTVRYIVVDTGTWLSGRRVIVSPVAFAGVDWRTGNVELRLTREQIESSPPLDAERPLSRSDERKHFRHYGWPFYWGGPGIWGTGVTPAELAIAADHPGVMREAAEEHEEALSESDPNLGSAREMLDYRLETLDGSAGNINDLLIDDEGWDIRYLAVGSGEWFNSDHVLLAPQWIARVNETKRAVYTDLTRDDVRQGPAWDPRRPMDRDFERHLHQHMDRPGYWRAEGGPLAP